MKNWLNDWLTFENDEGQLRIVFDEEQNTADQKSMSVEVFWNNNDAEVDMVQLNMKIKDALVECTWKPHLSPEEDMVVGDLFFQSPAIVLENGKEMLALIPDIDYMEKNREVPHYIDYVKDDNLMFYGLSHYEKTRHVYHKRVDKKFSVQKNQTLFKFYIAEWSNVTEKRDFSNLNSFLWDKFGHERMSGEGQESYSHSLDELEKLAEYTYEWAFNHWEPIVWQEFEINDNKVGANVLIVRAAQKPGLGKEDSWREKKSIWNQAWFSSLRSAYGYYLWGKEWGKEGFIRRANLAKNFALSAPQTRGLFPSVYTAGEDLSWENGEWGHSNRRPENHEDYGHLLDMSWTAYWMMKWYEDIEKDSALLEYCETYAERLLELQDEKGSFPGWVHMTTGEISHYLIDSPETSMHSLFLTRLYKITGQKKYLEASKTAMDFVIKDVIPNGRWEDFETYWSCSRTWEGKVYNERDPRSGLYNQCSFSIYWTTEALKDLYKVTDNDYYLSKGEQTLAELSLYQAIWNPEFVGGIPVIGGFAVMNTDDEWNDARQSLFALTYEDYYQLTGKEEYKYRSLWAMRASYYMMYCPENEEVKKLYDRTFPFLDSKDYGFEMENAHHGENIDVAGEFTIFDWGNGSASASLAELFFRNKI